MIFSALGALLRGVGGVVSGAGRPQVGSLCPASGRELPARGVGGFLEKPAQASAALAFPRRAIVRAPGDRAAGRGEPFPGRAAGQPGRAAPPRKRSILRVARSPRALPNAPLGGGEGAAPRWGPNQALGFAGAAGCAHFLAWSFLPSFS